MSLAVFIMDSDIIDVIKILNGIPSCCHHVGIYIQNLESLGILIYFSCIQNVGISFVSFYFLIMRVQTMQHTFMGSAAYN